MVGRIVHDAEVSALGAKLNESSLVLESSRMMGSGVRVPIRFAPETKLRGTKGVGGMSFFPGAIVALRGRNGGGGFFLVEELLSVRYTPSISEAFSRPIGTHHSSCPQSKCLCHLRAMPTLPFRCVLHAGRSAWTRTWNINPGRACLTK